MNIQTIFKYMEYDVGECLHHDCQYNDETTDCYGTGNSPSCFECRLSVRDAQECPIAHERMKEWVENTINEMEDD